MPTEDQRTQAYLSQETAASYHRHAIGNMRDTNADEPEMRQASIHMQQRAAVHYKRARVAMGVE